jgi:ankyrin repeat protein
MTPLHYAALGGHLEVASELIKAGAKCDETDGVMCDTLSLSLSYVLLVGANV